jgi:hypothetical protein
MQCPHTPCPCVSPMRIGPCMIAPCVIAPCVCVCPRAHWVFWQALEEEQVAAVSTRRPVPHFESGDILEVTMVVPENQRRTYIYKGVCIARYNKGLRSAFKVGAASGRARDMCMHARTPP